MRLEVYGRTRPFPGETVSGDGWLVLQHGATTRIAIIDGAGHGAAANQACSAVQRRLTEAGPGPMPEVLRACHAELYGTRGAVVSLVDVGEKALGFAGVGNADVLLITPERSRRLTPDRGLLGALAPRIHVQELPLPQPEWRLVMISDGIRSRIALTWDDVRVLDESDVLLESLIERWGRDTDDATIVIVAPSPQ
ncbi:MAG TPA: SpoIIE family protein phosphatase [Dehalococcoidia bacterium]|nr:SpoIIE family protein phosphatase [Dehalococcoidia bacterium]